MNCNNYNTIRVTAGNAFSLLLPLKAKQYVSEQPIEEVINAALLTDAQVLLNNEEWSEFELGKDGVLVRFPSTLSKGVYNIELTAKYGGVAIRAAYFQCLSIVAWSYQADAENYIPTSPIVADAAFIISANGDEEVTALKEQYRDAIAATEAEKVEYERKVAELNGVAQESTSREILNEVGNSNGALQSLADSWNAMVVERNKLDGYEFESEFAINGVGDLLARGNLIKSIIDDKVKTISSTLGSVSATYIEYKEVETISVQYPFPSSVQIIKLPKLRSITVQARLCRGLVSLLEFHAPNITSLGDAIDTFRNCTELRLANIPNVNSLYHPNGVLNGSTKLIDLIIGKNFNSDISLASWSPTEALLPNSQTLLTQEDIAAGFTSNLEKLLYNIREHMAASMPIAPFTITFSAEVKAAILADQETADAFTNKGWTIA